VQAPLCLRMRGVEAARPLADRLGIIDSGHDGG
jgi:hypothetical protein